MIDINLLRKNIKKISLILMRRKYFLNIKNFKNLEYKRKKIQIYIENLQKLRKIISKKIGTSNNKNKKKLKIININKKIKILNLRFNYNKKIIKNYLLYIPNIVHHTVPIFKNIEIKKVGRIPKFNFKIKNHINLGLNLGLNLNDVYKITGSKFMIMKNEIVRLYRAISQFMIDTHIFKHNYTEYYVPYIINSNSLIGTGQLPKFRKDLFKIKINKKKKFFLIPTAEVPLINLLRNKTLLNNEVPLKMVAHSPCFRYETKSTNKKTKGIIRQYQFDKVEIVQITKKKNSYITLEKMLNHVENILKKLNIPYRIILLKAKETSFSSSKTYDIEVWLPSYNNYCEISSISNCEDFQSRRINIKIINNKKIQLANTLNASGLAIGRTLVAILENYQQIDGSIIIPKVLIPYMNGIIKLIPNK